MVMETVMVTTDGDNLMRQRSFFQLPPNRDLRSIIVQSSSWIFSFLEVGRRSNYLFFIVFLFKPIFDLLFLAEELGVWRWNFFMIFCILVMVRSQRKTLTSQQAGWQPRNSSRNTQFWHLQVWHLQIWHLQFWVLTNIKLVYLPFWVTKAETSGVSEKAPTEMAYASDKAHLPGPNKLRDSIDRNLFSWQVTL